MRRRSSLAVVCSISTTPTRWGCSRWAVARSVRRCRCIRRSRTVRVPRTRCWRRCPPSWSSVFHRFGRDPFVPLGEDRADVFHLHHLTPQHEAVRCCWPAGAVVAHLHGTELKFLEAVNEGVAFARSLGTTLAGMPGWARANPGRLSSSMVRSVSCCDPFVGSSGPMVRGGAISSAGRLVRPITWLSCHPLTR